MTSRGRKMRAPNGSYGRAGQPGRPSRGQDFQDSHMFDFGSEQFDHQESMYDENEFQLEDSDFRMDGDENMMMMEQGDIDFGGHEGVEEEEDGVGDCLGGEGDVDADFELDRNEDDMELSSPGYGSNYRQAPTQKRFNNPKYRVEEQQHQQYANPMNRGGQRMKPRHPPVVNCPPSASKRRQAAYNQQPSGGADTEPRPTPSKKIPRGPPVSSSLPPTPKRTKLEPRQVFAKPVDPVQHPAKRYNKVQQAYKGPEKRKVGSGMEGQRGRRPPAPVPQQKQEQYGHRPQFTREPSWGPMDEDHPESDQDDVFDGGDKDVGIDHHEKEEEENICEEPDVTNTQEGSGGGDLLDFECEPIVLFDEIEALISQDLKCFKQICENSDMEGNEILKAMKRLKSVTDGYDESLNRTKEMIKGRLDNLRAVLTGGDSQ